MPQTALPSCDSLVNGWTTSITPQLRAGQPVTSTTPAAGQFFCVCLDVLSSCDGMPQTLTVSLRNTASPGVPVSVTLYCDGVFIATTNGTPGQDFTNFVLTLTQQQINAITDYGNLSVCVQEYGCGHLCGTPLVLGLPYATNLGVGNGTQVYCFTAPATGTYSALLTITNTGGANVQDGVCIEAWGPVDSNCNGPLIGSYVCVLNTLGASVCLPLGTLSAGQTVKLETFPNKSGVAGVQFTVQILASGNCS